MVRSVVKALVYPGFGMYGDLLENRLEWKAKKLKHEPLERESLFEMVRALKAAKYRPVERVSNHGGRKGNHGCNCSWAKR